MKIHVHSSHWRNTLKLQQNPPSLSVSTFSKNTCRSSLLAVTLKLANILSNSSRPNIPLLFWSNCMKNPSICSVSSGVSFRSDIYQSTPQTIHKKVLSTNHRAVPGWNIPTRWWNIGGLFSTYQSTMSGNNKETIMIVSKILLGYGMFRQLPKNRLVRPKRRGRLISFVICFVWNMVHARRSYSALVRYSVWLK